MTAAPPVRRRDTRFVPRCGTATLEFRHPATGVRHAVDLTNLSVAGLAFAAAEMDIEVGAILPGVVVRIGYCRLEGDFVVKHVQPRADLASEVRGLFYPETEEVERMLMALMAGVETVKLD